MIRRLAARAGTRHRRAVQPALAAVAFITDAREADVPSRASRTPPGTLPRTNAATTTAATPGPPRLLCLPHLARRTGRKPIRPLAEVLCGPAQLENAGRGTRDSIAMLRLSFRTSSAFSVRSRGA